MHIWVHDFLQPVLLTFTKVSGGAGAKPLQSEVSANSFVKCGKGGIIVKRN